MTPVCPFVKASRPDKAGAEHDGKTKKESGDSPSVSPKCPFGYDSQTLAKKDSGDSASISPKCPFGYDSQSFKLGPFSCIICQALLFESSRCVPCSHVFCKACISRFNDCPLCGADIEKIEADSKLQSMVDQFVEGHARIKRSFVNAENDKVVNDGSKVIYEDISLERGSFLVKQAMRAFRAQNIESAKSRLSMCADDIREQLGRTDNTPELCSQLGAVLGMLGDCCRAVGDSGSAIKYFEESIEFLMTLPTDDLEITHTLSVSLNKIGDLKYYDGDLEAARTYYFRALEVRRDASKRHLDVSLIIDVAVSLAKVADVDRSLQNENAAMLGFQEGVKLLESLKLKPEETALKQRLLSVLEFLRNQIVERQSDSTEVAV